MDFVSMRESLKENEIKKERLKKITLLLLSAVLSSASLGKFVFPCGLALLCTVPKKYRLAVLAGTLVPALFHECIFLGIFCPLYLYMVLEMKSKKGEVPFYTVILLSFSLSVLWCAYALIRGIKTMEDIFSLIAAAVSYPAFTFAFRGFFDKKREYRRTAFDFSLLSFAFAFSLAAKEISIYGTSLSLFFGALFTFIAARTKGFAFGSACGIMCGLASGNACTGALGVLGLSYGMLASDLEFSSVLLSFMLSVTGYFYLSGDKNILPALIMLFSASALFFAFRKKFPLYQSRHAEKKQKEKNISRYAQAFSSLSSLFYGVSDVTKKESITDLNRRIVRTVDKYCDNCEGCELDRSEISNFFTSEIRRKGVAQYSGLPLHIVRRCPEIHAMARDVNNLSAQRAREAETGLIQMADSCSEVSRLLIEASKKQEETVYQDKKAETEIKNALLSAGVSCDGVRVLGTRIKEITAYGVKPHTIKCSPEDIRKAVSSVTKTRVSEPEFVFNDDYALMKCGTKPKCRIECAKCAVAKTGESVCGDTVSVFENDEKYFYCLLSDGMGSGRDAALTSRLSSIMLEKLLSVGAGKESALRMLNKALLQSKEEIFATVDLLEIDRVNCKATIIKAGAAPTLFIHNGECIKFEAKTPPAGIMKQVIAEQKNFVLEKGDILVMLSDGILQTGCAQYLLPKKGLPPFPNAQALASQLIREAKSVSENDDDMSVCVMRVC